MDLLLRQKSKCVSLNLSLLPHPRKNAVFSEHGAIGGHVHRDIRQLNAEIFGFYKKAYLHHYQQKLLLQSLWTQIYKVLTSIKKSVIARMLKFFL